MGTGDWNDGMNRVGLGGKGESVWLAWFLYAVLSRFAPIASDRGEHERAQNWRLHISALKASLEREAWDGEWYLRAFYDDGAPLGSRRNDECRIDSIAQSWGVISRAAEAGRSVQAMESVYQNLVRSRDALVLLLTPPFGQADPQAAAERTGMQPLERGRTGHVERVQGAAAGAASTSSDSLAGSAADRTTTEPSGTPAGESRGESSSVEARGFRPATERGNATGALALGVSSTDQTSDHADQDPGYIKGYVPGIRENGGQYTHGAVWNVLAFAMLGNGRRAFELFSMLNPINHSSSRAAVQRYKVEPYVLAGDVYAELPHVGRGGWTWYTGSSGWLYRVTTETILGFQMRGMNLRIDPCISPDWPGFSLTFRYHSTVYEIRVENPSRVTRGVALTRIDGAIHAGVADIRLTDDRKRHEILVVLG
jgi:cellobiose phosphorylase